MQNLIKELESLFEKDERIYSNGKFLKNKVTELALKHDDYLIDLLLSDIKTKEHFFTEKILKDEKIIIFDKNKFIKFINNKMFLPDSFTSFKNKIGLMSGSDYLKEKNDVVLAWAYKDCVLEGGQDKEDQKREEIFYNEILAPDEIDRLFDPKVLTNFKKYDSEGEHRVDSINDNDNLIIKGNNLLALHSLKQKYRGKVKLIYIDPPYNTGNDSFHYNDRFNHSTWLTFMKNRLEVARELLRYDGLIYVQCDNNEFGYLKVLMDEIFRQENFIANIVWQRSPEGRTVLGQGAAFIVNSTENIFCFAKDKFQAPSNNKIKKSINATERVLKQYNFYFKKEGDKKLIKEIYDSKGNPIKLFRHTNYIIEKISSDITVKERIANFKYLSRLAAQQAESSLQQKIIANIEPEYLYSIEYKPVIGKCRGAIKKAYYLKNNIVLFLKDYAETDGVSIFRKSNMNDFWSHNDIPVTGISEEGNIELKRGKKPEKLLKRIIEMSTDKKDIILDFHLGSGTTAAVAHKMGRQYIGIEQLCYRKNDSVIRLQNVINGDKSGISKTVGWQGGGSFIYIELKKFNEEYIQSIKAAENTETLLNIYKKMQKEAFFRYEIDFSKFDKKEFSDLPLNEQKKVLLECLDKNHLYVNLSEIDDTTYNICEEDKKLNKIFYK